MSSSSSALVLLALVISGYLFNLTFYPLRYFSGRAEGQKLFFMAAGSGLIIGAFVFGVTGYLKNLPGFSGSFASNVATAVDTAIPVPFGCRLVLTIVVAIAGGVLLNGVLWLRYGQEGRPIARRVYNRLTDQFGNPLSQLLRRAADRQKLVMLTLKSRKIYCGRILEVPPDIESDGACIEILPSFSGYRDKDSLRLGKEKTQYPVITVWETQQYLYSLREMLQIFEREVARADGAGNSEEVVLERQSLQEEIKEVSSVLSDFGVQQIDVSDWVKVIPIQEIESASFYDPDSYKNWFAEGSDLSASTPTNGAH